jgi:hypothetical protein
VIGSHAAHKLTAWADAFRLSKNSAHSCGVFVSSPNLTGHLRRRQSRVLNGIPVPLAEEADGVAGTVHDHRKEIGEVAAEDAHVQGGGIGESGVPPAEDDTYPILAGKLNLRIEKNGGRQTTHATE